MSNIKISSGFTGPNSPIIIHPHTHLHNTCIKIYLDFKRAIWNNLLMQSKISEMKVECRVVR